jgi:hypothetical protein
MAGEKQPNGQTSVLSTLAQSSNQWVQLATVGLVALSGFGNWAATWNSADRNKAEIEVSRKVAFEGEQRIKAELVKQVAEIHTWMRESTDEFHKGNADSATNRKTLVGFREDLTAFEIRQLSELTNQEKILETQTTILKEIHEIVTRFDHFKKLEQQRGVPP